jgi:hypothetical protein
MEAEKVKFIPDLNLYPVDEQKVLIELEKLFRKMYEVATQKTFVKEYNVADIIYDGFYPYFTKQKAKILFVGREVYSMEFDNYIENILLKEIKNINKYQFHKLMFYLAYAFNNNFPEWKIIPEANVIADTFATEKGVSFAFMNYSKFNNESGLSKTDWEVVDNFIETFSTPEFNFLAEEIEIINPDLIITMNLEGRIKNLGKSVIIKGGEKVSIYEYYLKDKVIPLLDSFHFSAVKNDIEDFYKPLKAAYISFLKK